MPNWIDVHTHLQMLEHGPSEELKLAEEQGVKRVITIGTQPDDLPIVLELASRYAPAVACTIGIHPHDAKLYNDQVEKFILDHASEPAVVAIGEIGLDYYYDNSPREEQQRVFRTQMALAAKLGLPVEIHTRDAEKDTLAILQEYSGQVSGILHCFTGSYELAQGALALGYNISISGVVTFKNADDLRKTVAQVPIDRIHVETDAPFLTPIPFRGKKNRPAFVVHVAEKVAEIKNVSLTELSVQTNRNASKMFKKLNVQF